MLAIQSRLDTLEREAGEGIALATVRAYQERRPAVIAELRDGVDRRDRQTTLTVARAFRMASQKLGARHIALMAQILANINPGRSSPVSRDIPAEVIQLVARHLSLDSRIITREASIVRDLGADSLDAVELIMGLEEA